MKAPFPGEIDRRLLNERSVSGRIGLQLQELDVPESERLFRRDRPAVGQIERHDVS